MDDVRPVFVCCGSDALSHSLEYDLPSPVYVEVHTEKEKNDTNAARSINNIVNIADASQANVSVNKTDSADGTSIAVDASVNANKSAEPKANKKNSHKQRHIIGLSNFFYFYA